MHVKLTKTLALAAMIPLAVSCGKKVINNTQLEVNGADSVKKMTDSQIVDLVKRDNLSIKGLQKSEALAPGNWFTMAPSDGCTHRGCEGTRADKAYQELNLRVGKTIVVAVIDSGVDVDHEDLKGKIWVNEDEVPNDGIDNDNNGYIDDINGWNFIGGHDANGNPTHVNGDTLEVTRELVRYEKRIAAGEELNPTEQAYFEEVQTEVEGQIAYAKRALKTYGPMYKLAEGYKATLRTKLGMTDFATAKIRAIDSEDSEVMEARDGLLSIIAQVELGRLVRIYDYFNSNLEYYYNKEHDMGATRGIVGDDPNDFSDRFYGNNSVQGPDAGHGTHVAGAIAAIRGNTQGNRMTVDGVATNVKIMVVRTVPNGDERDKDVVHSVRYAVDNGADIINMSFGKSYSHNKTEVDKAFKYAEDNGVLVVHAAGNDNSNIDVAKNFPNRFYLEGKGVLKDGEMSSWLEIGASTAFNDLGLPADFSNYGQKAVNLFAPGHDIYSTVPDNKYDTYSGTSMACPVTAGVAALVLSQYEGLSALELKNTLMNTVRKYDINVTQPGSEVEVPFSTLSIAGGVVDAYAALESLVGSENDDTTDTVEPKENEEPAKKDRLLKRIGKKLKKLFKRRKKK